MLIPVLKRSVRKMRGGGDCVATIASLSSDSVVRDWSSTAAILPNGLNSISSPEGTLNTHAESINLFGSTLSDPGLLLSQYATMQVGQAQVGGGRTSKNKKMKSKSKKSSKKSKSKKSKLKSKKPKSKKSVKKKSRK